LLGHVTLKGDFIVLNLDKNYSNRATAFVSYLTLILNLLSDMVDFVMWAKIE